MYRLNINLDVLLEGQMAVWGQPGQRQLGSDGSSDGSLKQQKFTCRTPLVVNTTSGALNLHHTTAVLVFQKTFTSPSYRLVDPGSLNVLWAASPPGT